VGYEVRDGFPRTTPADALRDALEDGTGNTAAPAGPGAASPAWPRHRHGLPRRALRTGLDLDIPASERASLLGEPGSRKTQTTFSVLGILPDSGRVSADGARRGYGPQPHRPARQAYEFPALAWT
jgi:hypothetical protein